MKFSNNDAHFIEFVRTMQQGELVAVKFRCEWCSGSFSFFSSPENYASLLLLVNKVRGGSTKKGSWLSEEGDIEITLTKATSGHIRIDSKCFPTVNLENAGSISFSLSACNAT